MRRLLALILLIAAPAAAQTPVYERFYEIRTNGNDSTYGQGLTHRYVSGELRFLNVALNGTIQEFRLPASGVQTATTGVWSVPGGVLNNFSGIWWEAAKNRLWVTSAEDYTATYQPAKVTILTLGNGSATIQKQFTLNVPAKRVYGGCNAVPASLVAKLGGPYVCGWGGYTSLVQQGGSASIGPTMYAIPDPDTFANGATIAVRVVLDAVNQRGVRKTIPQNYFDGGDPRPNPPTRPTVPVSSAGNWLSPNTNGLGWMVWGDSYYNTGVWIGDTFAAVASLCKGFCWYQSSDLHYDGRQFELHTWPGSSLGVNIIERPSTMTELTPPRGNTRVWEGNRPVGNIGGATYDATTGKLWIIGYPFGTDDYTGRLFTYAIGTGVPPPPPVDPPPPPPVDPPPPVEPPPTTGVTHEDLAAMLKALTALVTPAPQPVTVNCTVTSTTTDTITIRRSSCGLSRPATGSMLRVVR